MLLPSNKEIGGYFGFSLPNLEQFPYIQSIKYNSARSAFFDLLNQSNIKKIWMPKFICDSMIEPLLLLNIDVQYYDLDEFFYPIIPNCLKEDEYLFYVNYFGLCTSVQQELLSKYPDEKIIFDHSQAFFVTPFECFATLYSPRKILPIAEGGLLVTKAITAPNYMNRDIEEMIQQYYHCFTSILSNTSDGYESFKRNEMLFTDCIPKKISQITEELINCFDYKSIKTTRLENFKLLHSQLGIINKLHIDIDRVESPLTYPLLLDTNISTHLIKNKIFTPTYWLDSLKRVAVNSFEYGFIFNTTHLVCDQRYSQKEMELQIIKIKEHIQ